MKIIKHNNATILCDEFAYERKPDIKAFISSWEVDKIIKIIDEEFYLVLGWDGTMLRAIQGTFKDGKPYLWINFWSKGFLLNERWFTKQNWMSFKTIKYPMLNVEVDTWNWVLRHTAFNEVQVKTAGWHMTDLNLQIWKHSKIRLKWDGIIIVTPAGSTGYNMSAWWPVLPHSSPNFIATPLLTFEPKNMKPIVFESSENATITNNNERWYEFSVYADATPVIEKTNKDVIIIVSKCKTTVRLLIASSYDDIWHSKVYAEQWFEFIE